MPATYTGTRGQYSQMAIAGFNRDIDRSESPQAIAVITRALTMIAPALYAGIEIIPSTHTKDQLDGVLHLVDGREYPVEAKWRPTAKHKSTGDVVIPRDVLLEDVHVYPDGSYKAHGWLWTTPADRLLVVAYETTGQAYICAAGALREAADLYWREWWDATRYGKDICPIACAPNRRQDGSLAYYTLSLCVPFDLMLKRVSGSLLIDTRTGTIRDHRHGEFRTRRIQTENF